MSSHRQSAGRGSKLGHVSLEGTSPARAALAGLNYFPKILPPRTLAPGAGISTQVLWGHKVQSITWIAEWRGGDGSWEEGIVISSTVCAGKAGLQKKEWVVAEGGVVATYDK